MLSKTSLLLVCSLVLATLVATNAQIPARAQILDDSNIAHFLKQNVFNVVVFLQKGDESTKSMVIVNGIDKHIEFLRRKIQLGIFYVSDSTVTQKQFEFTSYPQVVGYTKLVPTLFKEDLKIGFITNFITQFSRPRFTVVHSMEEAMKHLDMGCRIFLNFGPQDMLEQQALIKEITEEGLFLELGIEDVVVTGSWSLMWSLKDALGPDTMSFQRFSNKEPYYSIKEILDTKHLNDRDYILDWIRKQDTPIKWVDPDAVDEDEDSTDDSTDDNIDDKSEEKKNEDL